MHNHFTLTWTEIFCIKLVKYIYIKNSKGFFLGGGGRGWFEKQGIIHSNINLYLLYKLFILGLSANILFAAIIRYSSYYPGFGRESYSIQVKRSGFKLMSLAD
jgi:hypothetical protein